MSSTQLFSRSIAQKTIIRTITNYKGNAPSSRRTKVVLSNGATVSVWTSLPFNDIWRSDVDSVSNPPVYEFDSKEVIEKKRRADLESKFSQLRKR
ncbi:hypothetical protein DICPUDRAFT_151899 [Dictyostelium purpureum]|uniref:Uncharacterized protein n=1 Tax=Dictyostelium purpureum TaxID=5786 RepID=F0ZK14_DICPU|nr:uncharacterized protein DICPUDRAFT_151899 [Dictyostelium purpureum]EGC35699.1 hypothetical protein DICPUDRAFT_151899 [Dictyostelium purpureum]|eukprot:XP_003287755.1 hypothetical protein DICPUDRAFT_151899 [Dictyostelium purpureum]